MDTSCEMAFDLDCKSRKSLIGKEIYNQDLELTYDILDLEWEFDKECKLKMLGAHLGDESPIVLYFGENGQLIWNGLKIANSRLVYFSTIPTSMSSFYQLAQKAAGYVFEYLPNGGVYIVGHGIGALLAAKILSDKDFFTRKSYVNKLYAVFLISGMYNVVNKVEVLSEQVQGEISQFSSDQAKDLETIILTMNNESPLFDNFDHLLIPGVRLYVFSANDDHPQLKAQSRQMFDRFADFCDQDDLHFEIKEKFTRESLLTEMYKSNNFLGRLIRYDICLSQSR